MRTLTRHILSLSLAFTASYHTYAADLVSIDDGQYTDATIWYPNKELGRYLSDNLIINHDVICDLPGFSSLSSWINPVIITIKAGGKFTLSRGLQSGPTRMTIIVEDQGQLDIYSFIKNSTYIDIFVKEGGTVNLKKHPTFNETGYIENSAFFNLIIEQGGLFHMNGYVVNSGTFNAVVYNGGAWDIHGHLNNSGTFNTSIQQEGKVKVGKFLTNSSVVNLNIERGGLFHVGDYYLNPGITNINQSAIGGSMSLSEGKLVVDGVFTVGLGRGLANGKVTVGNNALIIVNNEMYIEDNSSLRINNGGKVLVKPTVVTDSSNPLLQTALGGNVYLRGNKSTIEIDQGGLMQIASAEYSNNGINIAGGNLDLQVGDVYVNGELQIFRNTQNKKPNSIFSSNNPPVGPPANQPITPQELQIFIDTYPILVRIGGESCDDWDFTMELQVDYGPGDIRTVIVRVGCNQGDVTLPVELLSFEAVADGREVTLKWQTATELNNDYFTVERSSDGINFETIGMVSGNGTTKESKSYTFSDRAPLPGMGYYRLSQTDYDGSHEVLGTRAVNFLPGESGLSAYPNPLYDDVLTLRISGLEANREALIRIIDPAGRTVYQENLDTGSGHLIRELNLEGRLERGMYMINVIQGNRRFTGKLSKM